MIETQTQIERRRERAMTDIARVVNRGGHVAFSTFDVTSTSDRTYRVQIRSLTELQNSCTCPDYLTNLVGTCKHIEGVLLNLKEALGEQWDELAAQAPPVTQIYLHHAEETTVRALPAMPVPHQIRAVLDRYFDADGVLTGPLLRTLPALLADADALPSRVQRHLLVADEVRAHLDRLQDLDAIRRQREWFLEQVEQGTRSLSLLSTRLYPYQEQGAMHLAFGARALLADDMGLGKTVQAIAACSLLHQLRDIQKVLIVCPASLKHQWAREIGRFTSFPATVIGGPGPTRRQQYHEPGFFKIVNYEIVLRDVDEMQRMRPDVIILDEAQRIKNWRTKTADAVKRLRSRYAFVLTGTPLENRLDELYSVFQFLDPTILGPLWRFNQQFFQLEMKRPGSFKVLGYKNLDQLRGRIGPYVLRRTRDQVLTDLPDRTDNNFFVEMTREQWNAYEEYQALLAKLIAISKRRPLTPKERELVLMSLIKMRLICNALALHDPEAAGKDPERTGPKLRELRAILEDEVASNGHKALVFSQWTKMLDLTEPGLDRLKLGHVKLTGAVPTAKRGTLIERFFEDPDCRVFLSSDAGGVGLNLQAASLVINLDLPWNPAVLEQRIARAHRHGQSRPVQVVNLIAQGTIEERILDTLAAKQNVFASIFGVEEGPADIRFEDTGQELLKTLAEMLGKPEEAKPELELAPVAVIEERPYEIVTPLPTLEGFVNLLVGRFPGRVLLVTPAPQFPGTAPAPAPALEGTFHGSLLVVVDRDPAGLRPDIERLLNDYFRPAPPLPGLHLMEQEGYRALLALTSGLLPEMPETEVYRAPAMAASRKAAQEAAKRRAQAAAKGLDQADRRLRLAQVVLEGGFPEEVLHPVREALGWTLTSLVGLFKDYTPAADLPSPRLVNAELVEQGRLPADLAAQLSRVRELTAPQEEGEDAPPPSLEAAVGFITNIQEAIDLGRQLAAQVRL
jgi:superfamily II DNA or RNA helicase